MTESMAIPACGNAGSVRSEQHRYNDVDHESTLTPHVSERAGVGTLEADVGPEMYPELLAAFLEYLSPQVAELNDSAAVGDVPAAQYVAHQIKGTASSFGALHLEGLAVRVLQMDPNQDERLRSLVSEIETEAVRLQAPSAV
jgi:HPt (histidine-containing phosphotransfer) domain-containing protein